MVTRPSKDVTFLTMAHILSQQATCSRRKVGCILTDMDYRIVGSGYNGNAKKLPHCIETPCEGITYSSGEGLEICEAIHAEQNALMQCSDIDKIHRAFVTTCPCMHCMKMLLNTRCMHIYFVHTYPHAKLALDLWAKAGRVYSHIPILLGD